MRGELLKAASSEAARIIAQRLKPFDGLREKTQQGYGFTSRISASRKAHC